MHRRRLVLRILRTLAVAALVGLAAAFAFVQISQRVFRHQAEHLLVDVDSLTVGQSTWQDFLRIQTKWGKWGSHDGACTADHCEYSINGRDWVAHLMWWEGEPEWLMHTLGAVFTPVMWLSHARAPNIRVSVDVASGLVSTRGVQLRVDVPTGSGPKWDGDGPEPEGYNSGYVLIAGEQVFRGDRTDARRAVLSWPESNPHPSYQVAKPSGCEGCLAIYTLHDPVPDATARPLLAMNLDCLTRWKPCVQESDIMPSAWKSLQADSELSRAQNKRLAVCDYPLAQLYSAAENAALVRVLAPLPATEPVRAAVSIQMEHPLKGSSVLRGTGPITLWQQDDAGSHAMRNMHPGDELLVLYPGNTPVDSARRLRAYPCGVISATPAALRAAGVP